jgi:tetratricopeptide (TPR) repeat protein
MRRLAPVLAVLLAAPIVYADTVYLKDTNLKLEGKVHRETEDFIILLVHNEAGQIRIPRSKILKIEYDIKTQLEKLAEDDYAGRYKVALWALEKGMFADAIKLLEELKGKEGVAADLLKVLAQTYERREQKDKALQNYSDYLKLHPEDAVVAEKVKELTKEVNPNGADGPTTTKVVEGLEATGAWVGERWPEDANPCALQTTTDPNAGDKTVCAQGAGGNKQKTAFSRTGDPLNLADSQEMVFKIMLNSPVPLSLAIAFSNADGKFYETRPKQITANAWNKVTFDLSSKDFKAEKSGWKHELPLDGRERVSRIYFLVYNSQRPFTLYVDSVFFTRKQQ